MERQKAPPGRAGERQPGAPGARRTTTVVACPDYEKDPRNVSGSRIAQEVNALSPLDRLLVVSNRLPIVLDKKDDGWTLKPGSGGLVSALAPVLSHRGGLWIGWPGLPLESGGSWEDVLAEGYRERGYHL